MKRSATSRRSSVLAASAAAVVALSLSGCGSALVAVRSEGDASNLEVAQRIADRECAARGAGAAQYVMTQHNPQAAGSQWSMPRRDPPEILYRCTPAAARTS
jgi:hypothetical protein